MTRQEVINFFNTQLVVPVNLVSKIYNCLVKILDFVGESTVESIIPEWNSGLTFNLDGSADGTFCRYADTNGVKRIFETKTNANTGAGHEPPSNPAITENTYWKEISQAGGSAIKEWQSGLYGAGLIIVSHQHSLIGDSLFKLTEPARPFNSLNIETEIGTGKWVQISGSYSMQSVVTTGGSITLDFKSTQRLAFKGATTISGNKNILIQNPLTPSEMKFFKFQVDAAGRELTFAANVRMKRGDSGDGNWFHATKKWIAPEAGEFEVTGNYDGTNWDLKVEGPY